MERMQSTCDGDKLATCRVGECLNTDRGIRVKEYVQYSDRITLAKLDTRSDDMMMLQVYMPTFIYDNEEVEYMRI